MSTSSLPIPARIQRLQPYVCARNTCKGEKWTYMDANESPVALDAMLNPFPDINRYPDPTADELRNTIGDFYGVSIDHVLIGNGCDELISLCAQAFVRPAYGVLSIEPTYGMYKVCADTFGASYWTVPLAADFTIEIKKLQKRFKRSDVIFLCTPNNPTGTLIPQSVLEWVIEEFSGLIVIDEAYGEFADATKSPSSIEYVKRGAKNVIVLRTFSKAFGAAGLRLGYGIADEQIITQLMKVKMPYNVGVLSQQIGSTLWQDRAKMEKNVRCLQSERTHLEAKLSALGCTVFPSVTNFFLMKPPTGVQSDLLYTQLRDTCGIVLRNFGSKPLLENMLRITVGTREQNDNLVSALSTLL